MTGFRKSLATVLETAAIPYGLALSTWGSGMAVMHFRGSPQLWQLFAFLLGGMIGYSLAAASVMRELREISEATPGTRTAITGFLHVLAVGGAVGAAALAGKLQGWVAWPLAGFAAILVYLVLTAVEQRIAGRLSRD